MYLLGSRNHFHVSAWFKVTQFLHSVSFLGAMLCTTEPLRTIISVPPWVVHRPLSIRSGWVPKNITWYSDVRSVRMYFQDTHLKNFQSTPTGVKCCLRR